MNAGTLAPDCAESTVRRQLYMPPKAVQQHLTSSTLCLDERMKLYGALVHSLVWVTECEMGLGDDGPFVELRPLDSIAGRLLAVYTSRDRAPADGVNAEPVAFSDLLAAVDDNVALLIDPIQIAVVVPPADVVLLRDVLEED